MVNLLENPFNFFQHIYCISLPQSSDRKTTISKHFENLKIKDRVEFIYVDAPAGNFQNTNFKKAGVLGCSLSHMRAVYDAVDNQYDNCLIIEDDTFFSKDYHSRMIAGLSELPKDWDILYFGGSPHEKLIPISSQLSTSGIMLGTIAYGLNSKYYNKILNSYFSDIGKKFPACCADNILKNLNKQNKSYTFDPYMCETHEGISLVENRHTSYHNYIHGIWQIHSQRM
mgnify:FL=1|tara:strand:+ start:432 stop:1112 length:681 start_codon:yes stop_codon:yes gene_type:complete